MIAAVARERLVPGALALLRVPAQILFSRSPLVGLVLLAAAATSPPTFAAGVLAVLTASSLARLLDLDPDALRAGDYGYSALLVGLGVGHTFGFGPSAAALVLAGAAASVLFTAALRAWLGGAANLPVLSLPFLGAYQLVLGSASVAGAARVAHALGHAAASAWLPSGLSLFLRSLGELFFLPSPEAGALVLLALVLHSRIAASLAAAAFTAVLALASAAPTLPAGATVEVLAINAMLTAVALGGVYFVPSSSSFLVGMLGALVSVLACLGLAAPFAKLGLPLLILPFNATVALTLFALRQRRSDLRPKSVDFLSGTPEENLAYFRTRRRRFEQLHPVAFQLPVRGAWTCTQGVDGAFTHKGAWRDAYDFEVRDADGSLHRGDGLVNEDFHCFRLPVLAAAPGTVVALENGLPDNAIGAVDVEQNWGNYVLLQHGVGLYSLVAHLARGSAKVHVGQIVRLGDVLGLAGSSGRSPRPHVHFQLQGTAKLGAPTLPCRFTDVVLEPAGAAPRATIAASLSPHEDDAMRNLQPGEEMPAHLGLELGRSYAFETAGEVEHLVVEVDLYGRYVLRSQSREASLFYGFGHAFFTSFDAVGDRRSAIYLLRAALPRVPLEATEGLAWTDHLPARHFRHWLGRAFVDLVSPFLPRDGIEMDLSMRREGALWVVEGASRRRDRRGAPVVKTRAELARGVGVVSVTVSVRGRAERLRRHFPGLEGSVNGTQGRI